MNKMKITVCGCTMYLLGTDKEGIKYWLGAPSWDCGWYWSIGYVYILDNNEDPEHSSDITSLDHFEGFGFKDPDEFRKLFAETPLSGDGIWELLEIMRTLRISEDYAECIWSGGAHITHNPCKSVVQDTKERDRINNVLIPALLGELDRLLSPEEETNEF